MAGYRNIETAPAVVAYSIQIHSLRSVLPFDQDLCVLCFLSKKIYANL